MNTHKTIISLVLLLSYTFGFANSLVPHCDYGKSFQDHSHAIFHEHHDNHEHSEIENDMHVAHNNHLDESVLDYLLCLIEDVEHNDLNHVDIDYAPIVLDNAKVVDVYKTNLAVILLTTFVSLEYNACVVVSEGNHKVYYHSPPLGSISSRGSPILS